MRLRGSSIYATMRISSASVLVSCWQSRCSRRSAGRRSDAQDGDREAASASRRRLTHPAGVSVTDESRRAARHVLAGKSDVVANLPREAFKVLEDGVEQDIEFFDSRKCRWPAGLSSTTAAAW